MFSIRERLCSVVTTTVSALLVIALLTAATTIVRTAVLHPQPVAHKLEFYASIVLEVDAPALLKKDMLATAERARVHANTSSADVVVWDGPYAVQGALMPNVREMSPAQVEQLSVDPSRLLPYLAVGARSFDRVLMYASGMIDFASVWDWNTKAIYVALVGKYSVPKSDHHPAMPLNEITFVDAVIRPVSLPRTLKHLKGKTMENMTKPELRDYKAFLQTVRNPKHEHETLLIDHVNKRLYLNNSIKYFFDDFSHTSLSSEGVTILVRYQVMSYSGWAPLREDVLYGVKHLMISTKRETWASHIEKMKRAHEQQRAKLAE